MAQVKGSYIEDVTDGPDSPEQTRHFLKQNPGKSELDSWFPTEKQAKDAAKRFERGERMGSGWDPKEFFAYWKEGINPEDTEAGVGWQVRFASREGMKPQWASYWDEFNARRERRREHVGS